MSTYLSPSSVDTRRRGRPPSHTGEAGHHKPIFNSYLWRPGDLAPHLTLIVGNLSRVSMDVSHVSARVAIRQTQGAIVSKGLVGLQARRLVMEKKTGGGGGCLIWGRKTCRGCGDRGWRFGFLVKPIPRGMPIGGWAQRVHDRRQSTSLGIMTWWRIPRPPSSSLRQMRYMN
jgi:hypothetical protein